MDRISLIPRLLKLYWTRAKSRPQDNSLSWWKQYVSEFFSPGGVLQVSVSSLKVFQGSLPAPLAVPARSLPRLFQYKYDIGVLEELLVLGGVSERVTDTGTTVLHSPLCREHIVFDGFEILQYGVLRAEFDADSKLQLYEFEVTGFDLHIDHSVIHTDLQRMSQALGARSAMLGDLSAGVAAAAAAAASRPGEAPAPGVAPPDACGLLQDAQAQLQQAAAALRVYGNRLEDYLSFEWNYIQRVLHHMQMADALHGLGDLVELCAGQQDMSPDQAMALASRGLEPAGAAVVPPADAGRTVPAPPAADVVMGGASQHTLAPLPLLPPHQQQAQVQQQQQLGSMQLYLQRQQQQLRQQQQRQQLQQQQQQQEQQQQLQKQQQQQQQQHYLGSGLGAGSLAKAQAGCSGAAPEPKAGSGGLPAAGPSFHGAASSFQQHQGGWEQHATLQQHQRQLLEQQQQQLQQQLQLQQQQLRQQQPQQQQHPIQRQQYPHAASGTQAAASVEVAINGERVAVLVQSGGLGGAADAGSLGAMAGVSGFGARGPFHSSHHERGGGAGISMGAGASPDNAGYQAQGQPPLHPGTAYSMRKGEGDGVMELGMLTAQGMAGPYNNGLGAPDGWLVGGSMLGGASVDPNTATRPRVWRGGYTGGPMGADSSSGAAFMQEPQHHQQQQLLQAQQLQQHLRGRHHQQL